MSRSREAYHFVRFFESRPEWFDRAACRGAGTKLFFPTNGQSGAKAIERFCSTCPVAEECAAFAEETNTHHGVWGGRVLNK